MSKPILRALALCLLASTNADATVTFQIMGDGYATGVSADGSVIVGNSGNWSQQFRWTQAGGAVPLGESACGLGLGCAGTPQVSYDGTKVSAMIASADTTYATMGLWTLGSGWQRLLPPSPPDAGLIGTELASAWGISGDGSTVVGLYWRGGSGGPTTGTAHAVRWTASQGAVDLGSAGHDSRANGASYDGRVIAGWVANPGFHNWWPTVWVDGAMTVLEGTITGGNAEARAVSLDGSVVVGSVFDSLLDHQVAARWKWNGSQWDKTPIGSLPGTFPAAGSVIALGLSADGNTVVGYNAFSNNVDETGFIWTPADGMMDVETYLGMNGITPPASFNIQGLTAISADGSTMVGSGSSVFPPFNSSWFMIKREPTVAVDTPVAHELSFSASPNPTAGATRFSFQLPEPADVSLSLYDVSGRRVNLLAEGRFGAGLHAVDADGRDGAGIRVPAGVYFAKLRVGAKVETRRIVIAH